MNKDALCTSHDGDLSTQIRYVTIWVIIQLGEEKPHANIRHVVVEGKMAKREAGELVGYYILMKLLEGHVRLQKYRHAMVRPRPQGHYIVLNIAARGEG